MKTVTLGDMQVPNVVLGLMRIAEDRRRDPHPDPHRSGAGIDFFDHAAVYGDEMHGCERRFAEALQLTRLIGPRSPSRPSPASCPKGRTSTSPTST